MPRYVERLLVTLLAALTILALYAALEFVVPQILSWAKYVLVVLTPFIIAVIVSLLMEPLIRGIQNFIKLSRSWSVLLAMLITFGGIGLIITLLIIHLAVELTDLSMVLPGYVKSLQVYIEEAFKQGQIFYLTLPPQVTTQLEQVFDLERILNTMAYTLQHWARTVANALLAFVSGLPSVIIIVLISLVASFFISRDREQMIELWIKVVPAPWGERVLNIGQQSTRAFLGFVKAQLILVLIASIISILGLRLIGIEYAITIGLIIGFFDLIPVLGPGTIYVPWALWAFLTGMPGLGFKILGLYLIVTVVRGLLEAKVVAHNLGLHPLAVLVAMYVGLKTFGVFGLVLGPIIVITIQAAIKAGKNIYKTN